MVLWGLTAVIAGYEVFLIRYIVTQIYFLILKIQDVPINVLERLSATGVGNIASLGMAIIAIAIVVMEKILFVKGPCPIVKKW